MALNWNITKVRDWNDLTGEPLEASITDALVWGCMFVGIATITEANAGEFYARYNLIQRHDGGMLTKDDGTPFYIKPEHVTRRIGLSTNAQNWTRSQFIKHKVQTRLDRDVQGVK